ncbi:MAG: GAF domain-containing protein [Xanthobacteraceae bacterium]|nr:GAF domain-containing protein [Xanthobacteraceae bacterium]
MTEIPAAVRDPQRIQHLKNYDILDTPPEPGFDDVVILARQLCRTPIALVSLVDRDRQWFKAASGLDSCETPISQSVCAHSLAQQETLNIPDLTKDERTRRNTLVTGEPFIRFYAGAPLITTEGHAIGTVCVIDTVARPGGLNVEQIAALEALARQVITLLDQRRLIGAHAEKTAELRAEVAERKGAQAAQQVSEGRYRSLFNSLDAGFCVVELRFDDHGTPHDYRFIEVNDAFVRLTGLKDATGKWMRDLAPDHEQHWFDIYGKVALTGRPVRFEHEAGALDHRWYDVHAFGTGAPGAHQVAILFNDITVRRNAEAQQKLLNDELGHRMKNSMALVQAIASQTLRGAADRTALKAFTQRVQALSRAHDVLLQQSWASANLADVVLGAVSAQADLARVRLSGPEISLEPKAALSLSLLLHELATNAVKYGSLSVPDGIVEVHWRKEATALVMMWTEEGGPPATPPERTGLGSRLIDIGMVGTSDVRKRFDISGFSAEFRAPLDLVEYRIGSLHD